MQKRMLGLVHHTSVLWYWMSERHVPPVGRFEVQKGQCEGRQREGRQREGRQTEGRQREGRQGRGAKGVEAKGGEEAESETARIGSSGSSRRSASSPHVILNA